MVDTSSMFLFFIAAAITFLCAGKVGIIGSEVSKKMKVWVGFSLTPFSSANNASLILFATLIEKGSKDPFSALSFDLLIFAINSGNSFKLYHNTDMFISIFMQQEPKGKR